MFNTIHHKLDTIIANQLVILKKLNALAIQETKMAETTDDIVAKITAETTILNSINTAATALAGGQANIAAEIAALKAQIDAGGTVDFSGVDAALATQDGVISQIATAIPANTG